MKRFWLVLLSLGLVLAFSASALAVDVKFSGSFYAAGMYLDKTSFIKDYNEGYKFDVAGPLVAQLAASSDEAANNISTAFYYQRLRVRTDFIVSPGLKLVTRFDALERAWGAPRSSADGISFPLYGDSAGSEAENENIAFDWAYIEYASPVGVVTAGYQPDGGWGTVFADNEVNGVPVGKIGWALTKGGFTGRVQVAKVLELSNTAKFSSPYTDVDIDKYSADIKYVWNGGEAGFRGFYWRSAALRPVVDIMTNIYGVIPYAKAKIGPVTIQAEVDYYFGDALKGETIGDPTIKLDNLGVFVDVMADFKMFYVGGTFAYVSGDDPNTNDKLEGGYAFGDYGIGLNGGKDWNPCLIMFNYDVVSKWVGGVSGYDYSQIGGPMTNAWFGQGRVGVRPIPALDILASLSYATADKKPSGFLNSTYGYEIDVTGTYKITNNLSYMLGVGYLFTGDYFKGYDIAADNSVRDNYMFINKLTLTF